MYSKVKKFLMFMLYPDQGLISTLTLSNIKLREIKTYC